MTLNASLNNKRASLIEQFVSLSFRLDFRLDLKRIYCQFIVVYATLNNRHVNVVQSAHHSLNGRSIISNINQHLYKIEQTDEFDVLYSQGFNLNESIV